MDFTVLIPTYNRRQDLARTLDAYEAQRPHDLHFEVVVIDDGSSDGSANLVAKRTPRRFPIRLISQQNAGPARARNRGLGLAKGELVLYTGDDIEPAPDLLAEHLSAHGELSQANAAVLGLTRWPIDQPLTATMRHIDGVGAQQFSYHFMDDGAVYDFRHLYTSNVSLRRDFLANEPGGFAEAFPAAAFEDAEFGHRLAFHGLEIHYRQRAVAYHHHHYSARAFYSRQVRCGRMGGLLFERNPELARWLGVRELERHRLKLLDLDASARHRLDHITEHLASWRGHLLSLATLHDPKGAPGLDALLTALFNLGYIEGLAFATMSTASAHRVIAATLADTISPAVEHFQKSLELAGADPRIASLPGLRPLLESVVG